MRIGRISVYSLLVAVLLLVLGVAIGCGGNTTTTTQATATTAPAVSTESTATTAAPQAETINLKFAAYHPPTTAEGLLMQDFIDQIEARTNGAVKIQFLPGGSLLGAKDMYDGVVNGIADIGEGSFSYNTGKFPETDLISAPLGVPSPWVITHTINDFYNEYKPVELDGTHVLWMWGNGPAVIMTAKKPVTTLSDLTSLKIRAQALTGEIAGALGAAPQSMAMNEMYDGLSKGVVDGVLTDPSVLVSFKLGDVIKHITDISKAVGNSYGFYITMNNDAWNKLPDDTKAIFDETANEMIEKSAVAINQSDIDGIAYAKAAGAEVITPPDAELAAWQAAVSSVVDDYIASLKDVGLSEDVEKEHHQYMLDRVAYWTEQQKTSGIPFPLQ